MSIVPDAESGQASVGAVRVEVHAALGMSADQVFGGEDNSCYR
jgi:hypothetical protein